MTAIIPVILAGGAGTRLWPVSRGTRPKHLASLIGDESLLQQAARRVLARGAAEDVITVGAQAQDFLIRHQLAAVASGLGAHRLLEPMGRNTAPAIALAALHAARRFSAGAVLWVCPSDHLITDPAALYEALEVALPAAAAGQLVTFGIAPTRPETEYGYIGVGRPLAATPGVRAVQRFVEKPARSAAEALIAEGGYLWNSGMFLFRADRILAELKTHAPPILEAVEHAFAALRESSPGSFEVPEDRYAAVPAAPIDKAVMEHAERIAVVPCDPGWSDLGSWHALWEQLPKDQAGNAIRGDAFLDASENCLVHAEGRLVACAGVRDLAVIETADAILVADRNDTNAGRRMVELLRERGRAEATAHPEEQRAWGTSRVLHQGPGFKITQIVVAPGGRLDLRGDRPAHWVVVAGTATVALNGEIVVLGTDQGLHVPSGAEPRVENTTDAPLCIIEVQSGGISERAT